MPLPHLGERHVDARRVQLLVELGEHLGRGHVDVGDRLALDHDPLRTVGAHERADLLAERTRVGEEQRRLPPVDLDARPPPGRPG